MMRVPLVSVIMPVFNAGAFLRPAVESVFAQTLGDFELLVVDDGGDDGSDEVLRTFTDPRLRILNHGVGRPNLGIAVSRNLAISAAHGDFIAFLNHDDTSRPERLAVQREFFRAEPGVALLGSAIANIDENGAILNQQPFPSDHLGIRWLALLDCPVRQSAMMARRQCFTDHAMRYDPSYVSNSDYDFIERLTRVVPSANLPETLTYYRQHPTNTSRLRYGMFVDAGSRIAYAAIRHELPDFAITREEVIELRAVVLGYRPKGARRSLAEANRAWELYLDLFEAFRQKHGASANCIPLRQAAP